MPVGIGGPQRVVLDAELGSRVWLEPVADVRLRTVLPLLAPACLPPLSPLPPVPTLLGGLIFGGAYPCLAESGVSRSSFCSCPGLAG